MKDHTTLRNEANAILIWAYENSTRCPHSENKNTLKKIEEILRGTHKTYKYILITQLVAKSVDKEINALSLQASAPFVGAFDSRSLCHKVIVPFERKFLNNALGGSNEPYLNKPARFTHLSENNAVRRGKDKKILLYLIEILENITTVDAKKYLCFAISILIKIGEEKKDIEKNIMINFSNKLEVYHFMRTLLTKSCEGEICALLVGTMEKLFYSIFDSNYKVICHKTNESGASSNEIGDIDIYYNDNYYYSIEVKDKSFTVEDLDFALYKMFVANASSGSFIYGPRSEFDKDSINACIMRYDNEKFLVIFENIFDYLKHMLINIQHTDIDKVKEYLISTSEEMAVKDITKRWILEVISR